MLLIVIVLIIDGCLQDRVHVPPAGGAGESFPRGSLPRRLRPRDARHEDGAARGQNTGGTSSIRS